MNENAIPEFLRPVLRRKYLVPVLIFVFFSTMLIGLKTVRLDQEHGDAALYYQVTDNIASRGVPASNISSAVIDSLEQQIPFMTAAQIAANPLLPHRPDELDYFQLHANYIFYPLALLAKLFTARAVLLTLYVLSFTGLVLLSYFTLQARGLPIVAACLFCVLVVFHPAWANGLTWQFYPERLFLIFGLSFMLLAARDRPSRAALIVAGIACASISERAAMMAGAFLVLYTLLYWKIDVRDRPFKLAFGGILAAYGLLVLKLVIVNPEYSSFFPHNFASLVANFENPLFRQHLAIFTVVNVVLLLVAAFEWRAAAIAVFFMIPNVIGNLGGSEKVGWYTHYHDLYLPALVWAALAGYTAAYRLAVRKGRAPVFYGATCVLALFLGSIDANSTTAISISPAKLADNFFVRFVDDSNAYFGPGGWALTDGFRQVTQAIPPGSVVSTPELTMSALYRDRILHFFPLDIDRADYAVLGYRIGEDGKIAYGGDIEYFVGAAEARRVDDVVVARMKRDGYDFAHPVLVKRLSLAVLKRMHATQ